MKSHSIVLVVLALAMFLSSCISYTTLQTPETLPPGKISVGAGAAVGSGAMFEVGGRVGVVENVDAGVKIALPRLVFADTKVQLTDGPFLVAADLGLSYMKTSEVDGVTASSYGLYPMILVGGRHWYVGGKGIYFWTSGSMDILGGSKFNGSGWLGPAAVAGIWLGTDDVKLLLEGNAFFFRDATPVFLGGIGVQFTL
jgi:hypothetical protein